MHIFKNLFGSIFSKTEPSEGIRLGEREYWIVDATQDAAAFYRALIEFAPDGAIVCLEGTTEPRLPALLEQRPSSNPTKVAAGTIWPKPDFFHIDATRQNLEDLANEIERNGIAIPAIHTHLYQGDQMLLEWYDAFVDDPILISGTIDESLIRSLAGQLESNYRQGSKSS